MLDTPCRLTILQPKMFKPSMHQPADKDKTKVSPIPLPSYRYHAVKQFYVCSRRFVCVFNIQLAFNLFYITMYEEC